MFQKRLFSNGNVRVCFRTFSTLNRGKGYIFSRISEMFNSCYLEDIDLGFRMRLRGESCLLVPDAIVRHIGSVITGRHSKFTIYHSIRNLIWTFIKNIPGPLLPFLIPLHALVIILLILMAIRKNVGGEAIRGLVDSLRSMPDIWHSRRIIQEKRTLYWWQVLRLLNCKPFAPMLRSFDIISNKSDKNTV